MKQFYVDLHIHIGRTPMGKPVKITGSRALTMESILVEALHVKGMDMVGVIDCHVPEILDYLEQRIENREISELADGGIRFGTVTLLLGCELEIYDEFSQGPIHILAFMPTMDRMKQFSNWLMAHVKNITLSTQRFYGTGIALQEKVKELEGLFIPAHVFTPYKSLYGSGVKSSLREVFRPDMIDAIELGLSSDTEMADQIEELQAYPYLTNSDAHSTAKIAREYQVIKMNEASFAEFQKALKGEGGRGIVANYGLNPRLGKYHRTACEACATVLEEGVLPCPSCGHHRAVKGVHDRLLELQNAKSPRLNRPPYIHQIPLEFIPGLGKKTMEKLRGKLGTEMNILHMATEETLREIIGHELATKIILAREGKLRLIEGGAGKFGKVGPQT